MLLKFFYLSNSITVVVKSFVEWDEKVFDWFSGDTTFTTARKQPKTYGHTKLRFITQKVTTIGANCWISSPVPPGFCSSRLWPASLKLLEQNRAGLVKAQSGQYLGRSGLGHDIMVSERLCVSSSAMVGQTSARMLSPPGEVYHLRFSGKFDRSHISEEDSCRSDSGMKTKQGYLYRDLLQHASEIGNCSQSKPVNGGDPLNVYSDEKLVWPWIGIVVNIPTGRGEDGQVCLVEFNKNWPGLHNAMAFAKAYEADHHGKKDWYACNKIWSLCMNWKSERQRMNDRKALTEEIERNAIRNSLLQLAALEQQKADDNMQKEELHEKNNSTGRTAGCKTSSGTGNERLRRTSNVMKHRR
ncbi:hypothetical protein WN943_006559 [Citrus x changshan-huyou]